MYSETLPLDLRELHAHHPLEPRNTALGWLFLAYLVWHRAVEMVPSSIGSQRVT